MEEQVFEFKKASRKKVKIKIGIQGPSGSGKTKSALFIAKGLAGSWEKVGVVDSENESASLYEDMGDFNVVNISAPFSPERYIAAIQKCVDNGMEVVIIDSGTHEWSGIGGYNDITDKLAEAKYKGNNWAARSVTMPRHRKFIDFVLQLQCHVIWCNRSKTETVQEGTKIKKLGMKEIQDPELEYEMSLVFTIDRDTHTATPSKDRTNVFEGGEPFVITEETGKKILQWCEKGVELKSEKPTLPPVSDKAFVAGLDRIKRGEIEIIAKLELSYSLTPSQKEALDALRPKD